MSICLMMSGVLLAGSLALATPQQAVNSQNISELVQRLSDADPQVRRKASQDLSQIGLPARPELVKAARSPDPEVRARAADLLRKLPWDVPTDPPRVRSLLKRYGQVNEPGREALIHQIGQIDGSEPALLRLLKEEPTDGVRWAIVVVLAGTRDAEQLKQIRETPGLADGDDPAALLLLGRAWIDRDKPTALKYLRRAIDANESRPTDDSGLLAFAYENLTDDAMSRRDFDQAADLLRRRLPQSDRRAWWRRRSAPDLLDELDSAGMSPSLAVLPRLMALHALFGPLDRFEFDARTWEPQDARAYEQPATLTRQIAFLFARLGAAPPVICKPLGLIAEDDVIAGVFFLQNKLITAAALEADAALSAPLKRRPDQLPASVAFLQAQIAIARDDETAAADLLERGMKLRAESRFHRDTGNEDDIWAQIHWFRAKAALAKGDMKTVAARVHDLEQLDPNNTDLALSIITWLKEHDQAPAGKRIFDKLYVQAKARLDSADPDVTAGLKNDLAWLCARSGEHLQEALQLAKEAVDASPNNPAFLDTLAEANFRAGHHEQAAKYESQALELSPENEFMKKQLEKFKGKGENARRE
jgi:tetratricopeptide (TPR) repeat protein